MNDKLLAGIVTGVGVAPACSVCILGPAFVGSLIAGALGWIADLRPVVTMGLAILGTILAYGFLYKRSEGRKSAGPANGASSDTGSGPDGIVLS